MDIERMQEEFGKAQQALIDKFKDRMKRAADEVLGELYSDCTQFAVTDAHTNYHNYLKDHFRESLIKEITEEYGHYSWAHDIRMTLMQKYPNAIRTKIIDDLEGTIRTLKNHIEQLQRNRY
jgi:hypothetical protein